MSRLINQSARYQPQMSKVGCTNHVYPFRFITESRIKIAKTYLGVITIVEKILLSILRTSRHSEMSVNDF